MANVKNYWKREDIYKLLTLVEERECLWNVLSKEHHDQKKRKYALTEISTQLDVPYEEVKRKLHSLRAQYSKEKTKIKNNKSGSSLSEKYKSKWEYFKAMKFMFRHEIKGKNIDSMINENTASDKQIISNRDNLVTSDLVIDESLDTEISMPCINKQQSSNPKRERIIEQNDKKDAIKKCLKIISNGRERDDYSIFGKFVASELRSLKDAPDLLFSLKSSIQKSVIEISTKYAQRRFTSSSNH